MVQIYNEGKFVHVRFWAKPYFDINTTTYTVNGKPIKQLSTRIVFNLNWTDHNMTITTKA